MPCITKNEALKRMSELHTTGAIDWVNLQPKIAQANEVITEALNKSDNPVVAFSGGKDSIVVLDLVRRINLKVSGVFCNTGNEYPETIEFVRSLDNIVWLDPIKSFWQCVKEYGMPVIKTKAKRHGNQCCNFLKEKPAIDYYTENDVDLVFTGLTADESRSRMMVLKRMSEKIYDDDEKVIGWIPKAYLNKTENRFKCHPIAFWSEAEVWTYIKWLRISYNPIYDMGIRRCGCRFCTAYISWQDMTSLYNIKDTKLLLKKLGQSNLDRWDSPGDL